MDETKILFENITEYNKTETDKFIKFHDKINKPYVNYLSVLAVVLAIMTIINIVKGNWRWLLGVSIILGGLYLYYNHFKKPKETENNKKMKDKQYVYDFSEKYITVREKNAPKGLIVNYFELQKIYETEENFYIYKDELYAYILNKRNFTIGNLSDFRDFIKKKCILKYRKKYLIGKDKKIKRKSKKGKIQESSEADILGKEATEEKKRIQEKLDDN